MTMTCDGWGLGVGPATTTGHDALCMTRSAVNPTKRLFRCGTLWVPTTMRSADKSVASCTNLVRRLALSHVDSHPLLRRPAEGSRFLRDVVTEETQRLGLHVLGADVEHVQLTAGDPAGNARRLIERVATRRRVGQIESDDEHEGLVVGRGDVRHWRGLLCGGPEYGCTNRASARRLDDPVDMKGLATVRNERRSSGIEDDLAAVAVRSITGRRCRVLRRRNAVARAAFCLGSR